MTTDESEHEALIEAEWEVKGEFDSRLKSCRVCIDSCTSPQTFAHLTFCCWFKGSFLDQCDGFMSHLNFKQIPALAYLQIMPVYDEDF